jgi:hypothetical protein
MPGAWHPDVHGRWVGANGCGWEVSGEKGSGGYTLTAYYSVTPAAELFSEVVAFEAGFAVLSLLDVDAPSEVEAAPSDVPLPASADFSAECPLLPARESVLYQPEPLKTMPAGWKIFLIEAPHCGHSLSGAS